MFTNSVRLLILSCGVLANNTVRCEPQTTASSLASSAHFQGRITAVFHGLQSRDGYLRVSLYDRADRFPDGSPVARRDFLLPSLNLKTPLDGLSMTFDGLPPGVYAVCAFHDCNGSGKLTQDFLGIPTEEWGMSGNPRPHFRAPRFDEAKIDLHKQEDKMLLITLHT